jgi:hypothetical protein
MKKFFTTLVSIVAVMVMILGIPGQSAALLLSGTSLIDGTARDIIEAPEYILDDSPGATNFQQQGFNEQQGVTLTRDIQVDNDWISEGTSVDSHMIFLNTPEGQGGARDIVEWIFDGLILGIMSDITGMLEGASTDLLGHPDSEYPPTQPDGSLYVCRGLEKGTGDGYMFSGNTLTLNIGVSEPGDWIRVVTKSAIPEPGTMVMLGMGLLGFVGLRLKLKK